LGLTYLITQISFKKYGPAYLITQLFSKNVAQLIWPPLFLEKLFECPTFLEKYDPANLITSFPSRNMAQPI